MDFEIRPVTKDEFEEVLRVAWPAFGEHPRQDELEMELRIHEPGRALAAVEDDRFVGELMGAPFQLTVPGGAIATAGVTSAGVLPTHRRRGILSALMKRQLEDAHERGEPISALHASEGPIYGRFGFGIATWLGWFEINRHRAGFRSGVGGTGSVRLVDRDEAMRSMPPVYEAVRPHQPGMVDRTPAWWEHVFQDFEHMREGASAYFFALHDSPEGVDGYVVYRIKDDWSKDEPAHTLTVKELMSTNSGTYAALWRYCFDVDLVTKIRGTWRPPDDPLLHLLSDPRALKLTMHDGIWLRVVDVEQALQGRRYATSDAIVLDVRDDFCGWNDGRYLLDGGPERALCTRTERDPDLVLSAADLGSVYLGGTRFDSLARAGRVDEMTPGSTQRADLMFSSSRAPWNPHEF